MSVPDQARDLIGDFIGKRVRVAVSGARGDWSTDTIRWLTPLSHVVEEFIWEWWEFKRPSTKSMQLEWKNQVLLVDDVLVCELMDNGVHHVTEAIRLQLFECGVHWTENTYPYSGKETVRAFHLGPPPWYVDKGRPDIGFLFNNEDPTLF